MTEGAKFVRESLAIASALTAVSCACALAFSDAALASTIALGAVIAGANFLLLARGITRAIVRASTPDVGHAAARSTTDPADASEVAQSSAGALQSGLRLVLLLLATLGILWYMPARPEGLAGGVLIVLFAATVAGFRQHRA